MGTKLITENRKARFNYEILEQLEVGIVLFGTEVKSLRAGKLNINDSYALVQTNELVLLNANIAAYTHGNLNNHDPLRTRKLLAHRAEINRLIGLSREKGLTLIPLRAYWKDGKVKLEVGVGRGKQLHDKRQAIQERDWNRDRARILAESRE
ncbi:SsrA-binding protein SmpB [Candidatus Magnetaquicoccus inordinatus]|uniref:SsrA-binding protein SmpB n=1 Tax=Candidatus Magnetaquicoccus inordinatus TaxID=2496818 RepID=UPI00102C66E4|nr:SsrA-binding protein SmpB [Candidatus Magnetaquicoccus inordinatus]